MTSLDLLGFLAGALTTLGFFPQVVKSFKTKQVGDLSLFMPVILILGMSLWFIYGYILNSWPIIIANVISILASGLLIIMKIMYKQ